MADNRIQFYGVAIEAIKPRLQGISIESSKPRLGGISIVANNFANGVILVTDSSTNEPISGATIEVNSTQTNPVYYEGNFTGTTNSDGILIITGSSTTGTSITASASGFNIYQGGLSSIDYDGSLNISLSKPTSKKVYVTNKGNTLINPNDTVLIELD